MSPPADNTAASSVGERLKAARGRQGFTLQKVSEDLHLDLWVLEAMEENRFRALGAPVYARGHLRKYAQLLGLDVGSVLADYEATHAGPVPPDLVPRSVEHSAIVPELGAATSRYAIGAIAAGVLLAAAAGLWWWYVRPNRAAVPNPASGVVTARSETDAVHATVPPGVTADRAADARVTESTATPLVAEPAVAGSKTATHPAPPRPTATTAEASDPTTRLATPADGSVAHLRLRFSADSWVEVYDASGTRLLYDERVADSARTVVGVPPFKVLLGNYPGVELSLDGKPVAVPERARYGVTARFRVLPGGSTLAYWGIVALENPIQPLEGMKDVLPEDVGHWQRLERTARELFAAYGYREMRVPMVEQTALFRRSIGEFTDIVEKEMFTFLDRDGHTQLTLRPEATAGVVRAMIHHGLLHNQKQRVWTCGPTFRGERPQKGRYRQFHQIDVEAFGYPGPDVDAEVILLGARLWKMLGITGLKLEMNSLGTPESRRLYRERLVAYFSERRSRLDADSERRLAGNPLRILDSKNPAMQELISGAPRLGDSLDAESRTHFEQLLAMLASAGVACEINPRLVRGLDYYSRTVFEWTTDLLGAQSAVCSGGRYDGLVEHLGGEPTPGIGWALGQERIVLVMKELGLPGDVLQPQVYFVVVGEAAQRAALTLCERLRDAHPGLRIELNLGGGNFKAQFRRADRSGAAVAVILGEDEVARGTVAVRSLRVESPQVECAQADLARRLIEWLPELAQQTPAAGKA